MSDVNTSKGHKKVLVALGREISHHEESLVELRALQLKLVRVYERSNASELISLLQTELNHYKREELCD